MIFLLVMGIMTLVYCSQLDIMMYVNEYNNFTQEKKDKVSSIYLCTNAEDCAKKMYASDFETLTIVGIMTLAPFFLFCCGCILYGAFRKKISKFSNSTMVEKETGQPTTTTTASKRPPQLVHLKRNKKQDV